MMNVIERDFSYGAVPFVRRPDDFLFLVFHEKDENDFWKFPKGHSEEDEEPEVTAIRELFEETGIEVEPAALIRSRTFEESYFFNKENGTVVRKMNTFFLAQVDPKYQDREHIVLDDNEFDDCVIGEFNEVYACLPDAGKEMFKEAYEYLRKTAKRA